MLVGREGGGEVVSGRLSLSVSPRAAEVAQ